MRMTFVLAATAIAALSAPAGAASLNCRVADPTGTPLNIRMEPNGQVVNTAINGELIQVFSGEEKYDSRGRLWYYVANRWSSAPDGYALAAYIRCR
jgi:TRAP-type C4-dicarboxylate transport system substrate-binding protein